MPLSPSRHPSPRNSTSYVIPGTETFRLGSRKLFKIYGANLQNIKKILRKIYYPDPGREFIQVDQSGAEALIVAYLCWHGKFRELFLNGIKPHVFVALHLFEKKWKEECPDLFSTIEKAISTDIKSLKLIPLWRELDALIKSSDDWPASKRYYYIAKQACHSGNYDIRANTFQMNTLLKSEGKIVLTIPESKFYLDFYRKTLFNEIPEWHQDVISELKASQRLYNLFGFPTYYEHVNEQMYQEAYAFVPQSTVATITNVAFTNLQNFIEDNEKDWDLIANTHDSYLCQAPIDEVESCRFQMLHFMQQELVSPRGEKFRMKAEAQTGMNWAFKE